MNDRDAVKAVIEAYLARWNARDYDGMAALFAEPCGMMGSDGMTVLAERTRVAEDLRAKFAAMEADGFDHTQIASIKVELCSPTLAQAHLIDLQRLRRDGSVQSGFDGLYLCSKVDGTWQLAVGAACAPGWRDSETAGTVQ